MIETAVQHEYTTVFGHLNNIFININFDFDHISTVTFYIHVVRLQKKNIFGRAGPQFDAPKLKQGQSRHSLTGVMTLLMRVRSFKTNVYFKMCASDVFSAFGP